MTGPPCGAPRVLQDGSVPGVSPVRRRSLKRHRSSDSCGVQYPHPADRTACWLRSNRSRSARVYHRACRVAGMTPVSTTNGNPPRAERMRDARSVARLRIVEPTQRPQLPDMVEIESPANAAGRAAVGYCPHCGRQTVHRRRIGRGTWATVILTGGIWLLALPFYAVRCVDCGRESWGRRYRGAPHRSR